MQDLDPLVASALEQLEPPVAAMAREAFDKVTRRAGPESLTQFGLQVILWGSLPLCRPASECERMADALGRLLELCGFERYAAICRSSETKAVYAAYRRSLRRGVDRAARAEDRSGIKPPDTDVLRWSDVRGEVEAYAFRTVAGALELAIGAGELAPRRGPWREQQAAVTERVLLEPRAESGGRSLLEDVLRERIALWAADSGAERQRILDPVADQLVHPTGSPDGFPAPAWLLSRAETGIGVDAEDDPPPDLVRDAVRELGWPEDRAGERVGALLALLLDIGALRRTRRTVRTTARGRALRADPTALWGRVVEHLWGPDAFPNAVAELAFVLLLEDGPADEEELVRRTHPAIQAGWRDDATGRPTAAQEVRLALIRLAFFAEPLGVLEPCGGLPGSGRWPNRRLALTTTGRAAALQALHLRATAPRR